MLPLMGRMALPLFIVASLPLFARACTLVNGEVDSLATSITVRWRTEECGDKIKRVEVMWEHIKFLACTDGHGDPSSRGVLDNLTLTKAVIWNLHPYSNYEVTIKATAKDRTSIKPLKIPVETKMARPELQARPMNSSSNIKTKSTIFFYWGDPEDCEKQHGRRDRYEVMLKGIDPWDSGVREIVANATVDNSYLAHELKPFSNYQLTVFNRNFDSRANQAYVNKEEPLVIQEQTKPTTPAAPQSLESSSQTNSSVFLSWRLPRPPTGKLDKFLLQVGRTQEDDTVSWRRVQVEGHRACNFNSEPVELYCYSVTDLDPGVSYRFRVRAWNLEVDEPSLWSSELTQATAMGESTISSSTLSPNPSSEITPTPSPSSSPLVIAVVSILAIIVIVAIVIVCLVYKLKITRLKQQMRNEEEWNQLGHLSHSSSYLPGAPPSASVSTRLADSYLTSLETSADFGSLRSANIQTRRLPEPPTTEPEYSEAYETMPVPGVFAPLDVGAGSPLESTRIQEEEITDVEGYLRPTFADRSSPIQNRSPVGEPGEPSSIPTESYGALGTSNHDRGSGRSSTSPSQPLISPPVNV